MFWVGEAGQRINLQSVVISEHTTYSHNTQQSQHKKW